MGKNGKDVRYLDRALVSGRVIMMWGRYYKQKEYIEWLWERDEEYKKEIENLNETISELNTTINDLEYQLSNTDKGGDRALAEKIYKFLVYQYWANIDKSEFMEAIWF